jgi:hypothetical protein
VHGDPTRHGQGLDRNGSGISGQDVIDRDEGRDPSVDGERRRKASADLMYRILIAVGRQITELAHIRRAVEVAPDDDSTGFRRLGEVGQSSVRCGDGIPPSGEKVSSSDAAGDMMCALASNGLNRTPGCPAARTRCCPSSIASSW